MTVVLRQNKPHFIAALSSHLHNLYPLHGDSYRNVTPFVHMYFPEQINGVEYAPFGVTLVLLFVYVYFSCNKIELVQSKCGIAMTAVITVLCSLFMSLGLTGLSLTGLFTDAINTQIKFMRFVYTKRPQQSRRMSDQKNAIISRKRYHC